MSKFKSVRVVVDGQRFDSQKEAARGFDLKIMQKAGMISELRFQVPFVLQESFIHDGKKEQDICYVADATYMENDKYIVEDTKSEHTRKNDLYRVKRKLLLFRYPDITFREYL